MPRSKVNTSPIPERFVWAAALLQHSPVENILEIGCGVGLLVAQVAKTLTTGRLYAIDQSPSRLAKARKRNRRFIEEGKLYLEEVGFMEADLPQFFFHRIVAFNVNTFFQEPRQELAKIKTLLHPTGKLFLFYQAPFEIDADAAGPLVKNLEKNDFAILEIEWKQLNPTSAICVIGKSI